MFILLKTSDSPMTIFERAQQLPDEALTNHHINDDSIEFTADDIVNAYIAGAQDVITLIMTTIVKNNDNEEIIKEIIENINDINKI